MGDAIVIVDDLDMDRFFLRRQLRKAAPQCEIVEFTYAEDALAYLRSPERGRIGLILVDINMPRMDGFEFADAFGALYPELKGDARLHLMSSSVDPEDERRASAHPAIASFMQKPVSPAAALGVLTEGAVLPAPRSA